MAPTERLTQAELDSKCAKARPWVRRFVEEYQDGRPWGYAIFEDPTIDDELMDECMCRIDNMLHSAQDAVFGRDFFEFPRFQWEVLDWPEGEVDPVAGEDDGESEDEGGSEVESGEWHASDGQGDASERVEEDDKEGGAGAEDEGGKEVGLEDEPDSGQAEGGKEEEQDEDDEEEISLGDEDTDSEPDPDAEGQASEEDNSSSGEEEHDADISTIREFNKLRAHFKWVRDRAKKRRRAHQPLDVDRSGIPQGLLRNVFLVIDQDVIDSIVVNSPMANKAWIWAVDPDYNGTVASMPKNGLKDEYYGYMRVRLQQLVNNFWGARHYHEDEMPLRTLWAAAQQVHDCAFVSVDPTEARMLSNDPHMGSALKASTV